jgi:hypothetical protein
MTSLPAPSDLGALRPRRPHAQRGGFFTVFDDPFLGGEVLEYLQLKEALPLRASCVAACDAVSSHEWRWHSVSLTKTTLSAAELRGIAACFPRPKSLRLHYYNAPTVTDDVRPFGGTREMHFTRLAHLDANALAPFGSAQTVSIRDCINMNGDVLRFLPSARSISLSGLGLTDQHLTLVSPTVERLDISDARSFKVTEYGLAALIHVRELCIDYAWLGTGAVFAHLPHLRMLSLTSHPPARPSPAHSARLRALAAAPSLVELALVCDAYKYPVSAFGPDPQPGFVRAFFVDDDAISLPLVAFRLSFCYGFTDTLFSAMSRLKHLTVEYSDCFTDDVLARCGSLEELTVVECCLFAGDTLGALSNIRTICLHDCGDLDFDNLLLLAGCAHLLSVDVWASGSDDSVYLELNNVGHALAQAVRDARRATGDRVVVTFQPFQRTPFLPWKFTVAPAAKRAEGNNGDGGTGGGGDGKRLRTGDA